LSFIGDIVGDVVGGITGAKQSAKGAAKAAQTQSNSADKAIAEARAARDEARTGLAPYSDAGAKAIAQQMGLIGLNGTEAQTTAINGLLTGPEYTTSVRQGEEAILQNASATGGLRGGNTNNSLANFRADLLASVFNNQVGRLSQVASLGENAAAMTGNNGINTGQIIGNQLTQQGAALAGGQIAQGNQVANNFNTGLKIAGTVAGF
jgi:hypothetical protein